MHDLYGPNADLMGKVMDLRLERQNLVMGNMANMNIPGYKARSLDFEKDLQEAVDGQNLQAKLAHTSSSPPPGGFDPNSFTSEVVQAFKPRTVYGADSVDMDKEMATMAKNSLMYNALTTVMKNNFNDITKVIADGGR